MPLASTIDKQIASRSTFNTSLTLYTSTMHSETCYKQPAGL